jgi:crotonobetainyl-CoA:carnitine CoA-transferase CaiB-like acyl-CoA transferase
VNSSEDKGKLAVSVTPLVLVGFDIDGALEAGDPPGPNYGQDNDYVYGELLGLSADEIAELAQEGAI